MNTQDSGIGNAQQPFARPLVSGRLNAEQLNNWRNVLLGMIGPWALMMPDDDVQKMRDEMQRHVGDESANI